MGTVPNYWNQAITAIAAFEKKALARVARGIRDKNLQQRCRLVKFSPEVVPALSKYGRGLLAASHSVERNNVR